VTNVLSEMVLLIFKIQHAWENLSVTENGRNNSSTADGSIECNLIVRNQTLVDFSGVIYRFFSGWHQKITWAGQSKKLKQKVEI
jgi:hypothetical protein